MLGFCAETEGLVRGVEGSTVVQVMDEPDHPFPEQENSFQAGIRVEGINHQHPSLFCVLSVAEVCGYHLRLHLDGYLSYDNFWTNVGFPDIHPVGWCEKNKHDLYIPQGVMPIVL
ncbi:hypothetical protein AB1E18_017217 [Capra hircus]